MLILVIFVCSINTTPQVMNCDQTNAVKMYHVPGHFQTRELCMARGKAYMNLLEDTVTVGVDEYALVKCLVDGYDD